MTNSRPIYSYSTLKENHIRTLRLLKGSIDDPLECSLGSEDTNLNDARAASYGAVSFEWGDPEVLGTILVDGKNLSIPLSLEDALRAIRASVHGTVHPSSGGSELDLPKLWADAICINQTDVEEKKKQIQLMGVIFQHAHPLFVWLGKARASDEQAMHAIRDISMLPDNTMAKLRDHRNRRYNNPDPFDLAFAAIRDLLRRTYFGRSWIIQELVQPWTSDIRILCGRSTVSWQQIRHAVHLVKSHPWADEPRNGWLRELEVPIDQLREQYRTQKSHCSLSDNLFAFRDHLCSFPDDKIWPIRSLCSDLKSNDLLPVAGQHISTGDLFYAATALALQHCRSLDILSLCGHRGSTVQRPASWLPDYWSFAQYCCVELIAARHSFITNMKYNATGGSTPEVIIGPKHTLITKGVVVGKITATAKIPENVKHRPGSETRWLEWASFYCHCVDLLGRSPDNKRIWRFMARSWPRQPKGSDEEQKQWTNELESFCRSLYSEPFSQVIAPIPTYNDIVSWQRLQIGRLMAVIDGRLLSQVPWDCRIGDEVILIQRARVPFVRRPRCTRVSTATQLIGECRLEDHMDGEMWPTYVKNNQLQDLLFE